MYPVIQWRFEISFHALILRPLQKLLQAAAHAHPAPFDADLRALGSEALLRNRRRHGPGIWLSQKVMAGDDGAVAVHLPHLRRSDQNRNTRIRSDFASAHVVQRRFHRRHYGRTDGH